MDILSIPIIEFYDKTLSRFYHIHIQGTYDIRYLNIKGTQNKFVWQKRSRRGVCTINVFLMLTLKKGELIKGTYHEKFN